MSILLGKSRKGGAHALLDHTRISALNNEKSLHLKQTEKDTEEAKANKILDKLFSSTGSDVKKLRRYGKNVFVENEKNEFNVCKKIENYIKNVDNENFASKENNSNDFELVEKHVLEKLISENAELESGLRALQQKISEIKNFEFKAISEENFLKHAVSQSKKKQIGLKPQKLDIAEEIKKAQILNKNLKSVFTNEKIMNDNMLQAIKTLLNEIDEEVYFDFEETLKKIENEYFTDKARNVKEYKLIDDLLGRVELLEKEKFAKEVEIKNLKSSKPEKAHLFRK